MPGGAVAVLHLDELTYSGDGPGVAAGRDVPDAKVANSGGATLHKNVSFSGLTLDLEPLAASSGAPAAASATADATEPVRGKGAPAAASSEAAQESSWSMRVDSSSCEDLAAGALGDAAGDGSEGMGGGGGSSDGETHSSASQRRRQHSCSTAIISGAAGAGLSGRLALRLAWPEARSGGGGGGGGGSDGPRAAAQLHLDPLRCQLRQRHLPLLSDAGAALAAVVSRQPQPPAPSRYSGLRDQSDNAPDAAVACENQKSHPALLPHLGNNPRS